MAPRAENGGSRQDEAARAGWLYYVAGNTQDQIAAKLGVSRQSAQRLVSLAVSEGLIKARSFPMPLPVIASSPDERAMLHRQAMIQPTLALAAQADVTFVGIGDFGPKAPLFLDGFVSDAELKALQKAGAVGEICGWAYDRDGRLIDGITNDRV